ncbi:equilibrative nucleoside transporter family protein [Heterostelium album PN500]|uniref:Equilibrative nucleoside transporter family protein n=1 Tax=Heterostelium pallidum (strain ATCC 26659 / Pp 5 / PN500) TaxID=670386 RepID=D3BJG7_HETP5|nr:equilibrative nucleoside transporter family protein [Heterostelium album PN500]EFA78047.1 equilibrative nucleoside transporter family protein [Heterostelium album PN500]|eukprot:XP_020430174.1 equilibrative nucleoside transporter family protein [Heterostelium album PN500]
MRNQDHEYTKIENVRLLDTPDDDYAPPDRVMPKISFSVRINGFLMGGAAILFFMPFIPLMIKNSQASAVSVSLVLTFFSGAFSSLLFGSVIGLVALFPSSYTGGVMSGCGIAGIIASILRIITKVAMPSTKDNEKTSFLYFFLGGGVLLLCFVAYQILLRLAFTRHCMRNYNNTKNGSINGVESKREVSIKVLLRKVWREAFVVFIVFFTTLSLFPGVTGLVQTINSSLGNDWFQIIFVLSFMIGDYIGRTAPKWIILFTPNNLWIPAVLRLVFFPLFAFCVKPLLFRNIYLYFFIMFVFALTNGYCGTLAMMFGPTKADDHEKEVTGIVMSFFLNFGNFGIPF